MVRAFLLAGLVGLAASLAPAPTAVAQDMEPILYVSQYKIDNARMDSLATLVAMFDAPWHDFIAEQVPGYQRWFYRHDTGDEHNFIIATMYPDWDYVRGDEIDFEAIFEAFKATPAYIRPTEQGYTDEQVEAMFQWAYDGSAHSDNIYRPIEARSWE